MALKATIFKATLNIADIDRGVYLDTTLTLARHPSETDQRLIVRLLAWALNADEALVFTKGLCADDEPFRRSGEKNRREKRDKNARVQRLHFRSCFSNEGQARWVQAYLCGSSHADFRGSRHTAIRQNPE